MTNGSAMMARKKPEKTVDVVKIDSAIVRDARVVVALTGDGLGEYLSRVLGPIVARDKAAAMAKEAAKIDRKTKD